jgi:hypothetical protein
MSPSVTLADLVQVHRVGVDDPVAVDGLGAREHGVGDRLRRRAAGVDVELDAEVLVRPAGVVAGGQDDAALGLVLADDAGGRRRRQDAALADQRLGDTVGRGHAQDDLDRLAVVEAPVAADHQRAAVEPGWVSKMAWTKFSR